MFGRVILPGPEPRRNGGIMNRQRFVKNILKMENEWLAADLVQLARKNVDAEYLEPLQIINAYTMDIPEAGFHKVEL